MTAAFSTRVSRLWRRLGRGPAIALAVLLALAAGRLWDPAPLVAMRDTAFDLYQLARPHQSEDRTVIIVDVDERSLAELGQWPWPRTVVARLVEQLASAGAAVIAFDIVFAEADRLSPHRLAATLAPYTGSAGASGPDVPDSDAVLAAAIAGKRVVLGQVAHAAGSLPPAAATDAPPAPRTSIATLGGDPMPHLLRYPVLLRNLPTLEAAAAGRGVVTVRPERDGIIRRVPLVVGAGDGIAPSLALEAMRVATGATTVVVKQDAAGVRSVVLSGIEIPTDQQGQLWPRFGRHDPSRFVAAADVIAGRADPGAIAGRIVLVGTSAAGLFDLRATPIERVMPGVELHAQVIEGIMDGSVLTRPNFALGAELVLAVAIGAAVIAAVPMLGALSTLLLGAGSLVVLGALSWWLFTAHGVLLDVTYPMLSTVVVFLLLTFANYFQEEARRASIRAAFGQYLAPELVERLVQDPDRLVLGGETRPMTVLFTDFRGFTTLAESFKGNPQGLTALMNRLLTPMSHAILKTRGTIDKYIGDAIMAFWNAPLDDTDHACHACEAALDILDKLAALESDPTLSDLIGAGTRLPDIGIGIATGVNVVGNMGSDVRFDYTVLGDSVNVASRLQGLTRELGARILVSASVAGAGQGRFAFLEIGPAHLKGRLEPETVFALLGRRDLASSASFVALQREIATVLDRERSGDTAGALAALACCRGLSGAGEIASVLDAVERRVRSNDTA